ncbi:MAG: hypothetical protein AB2A00_22515 [Myxococcota bacterium]
MHLPPAQPAGSTVPVFADPRHPTVQAAPVLPSLERSFPFAHHLGVLRWLYRVCPPRCRDAVKDCGRWLRELEARWPVEDAAALVDEAWLRVRRTEALLIGAGMERRVLRALHEGMPQSR